MKKKMLLLNVKIIFFYVLLTTNFIDANKQNPAETREKEQ